MADTEDLKSSGSQGPCGFESRARHNSFTAIIYAGCIEGSLIPFPHQC